MMLFEEVLKKVRERSYRIVQLKEMLKILKNEGAEEIFLPYGCLNCGRAYGMEDFEKVLFVIFPEPMSTDDEDFAHEYCSGICAGDTFSYSVLAKCRYCGHSNPFLEPEYVEDL